MGKLAGKVAIVTGAASGLGEAIATRFVAEGAHVVIGDVQADKGAAVAAALGERCSFVRCDVTSDADWTGIVDHATAFGGGVDILVNNAGGAEHVTRIDHERPEDHEKWVQINLSGVWRGTRAVIRAMEPRGGGSIVNISSIDGFIGVAGMTTYVATKFAVTGMTKSTALEFGHLGIRVNSIHPGITATPGVTAQGPKTLSELDAVVSRQPIARMGRPEEIAAAALFFASDESSYCTGSHLLVDGGSTAGRHRRLD